MTTLNMLDAKSNLSRLVEALESGSESEIIMTRNGKPAARLVPIHTSPVGVRIGVAKGKFMTPEPDPELELELELEGKVAALFGGPGT
jgi:prevent-host-death family protein